jgi:hypothetical protein
MDPTMPNISDVLQTSFSEMVTQLLQTAAALLPTCLLVIGLSVTVGFAVKFFKTLVRK